MGRTSPSGAEWVAIDPEDSIITATIGDVATGTAFTPDGNTYIAGGVALAPKFAVIDHATSGDNTIVAATSGYKIRVLSVTLVATGTVNVRFESGASGTALTGVINLVANTGFSAAASPWGHFETAGGQLLNLELSGATSVDGWLTYVLVPAS